MIPKKIIEKISGVILGFGGRSLSKYINSPESEIYRKGDNLYGIYQAKKFILKYDFCYLTEGYTDVLSMYKFGIKNVVASLGTSLTLNQIILIKRFTNNITIIYDSDESGINSCLRIIDILLEQNMNIKIISLPSKEDPDSFFRKKKYNQIINFFKKIRFKIKFLFKNKLLSFKDKKILILKNILISDLIIRDIYIKEVSKILDINEQIIFNEIEFFNLNKKKSFHFILNDSKELDPLIFLEEKLIQIIILYGNTIISSNNYFPLKGNKKTTIIEEFILQQKMYNIIFSLEKNKYIFNIIHNSFKKMKNFSFIKIFDNIKISQYFIETLLRYKSYYISKLIQNKLIYLHKNNNLSENKNLLLLIINLTKLKIFFNQRLNRSI